MKINYSEITKENFDFVRCMLEDKLDGKICERSPGNGGDFYKFNNGKTYRNGMILDFLTEIKEPLSFEEWFKIEWDQDPLDVDAKVKEEFRLWSRDSWNACLENQKLGVVVDEEKDRQAHLSFLDEFENGDCSFFEIWQGALKYERGNE